MYLLLLACVHRGEVATAVEGTPAPLGAQFLPGIRDVACDAERCLALMHDGTLADLMAGGTRVPDTRFPNTSVLRHEAAGWQLQQDESCEGASQQLSLDPPTLGAPLACVPLPPLVGANDDLEQASKNLANAWNHSRRQGWRTGFERLAPLADGVVLLFMPGPESGTLARLGGAPKMIRVATRSPDVRFPGALATHPTGQEVYLVSWPSPKISALDPVSLEQRWWVMVEGAAQGLFLDPSGRWLVVGRGPPVTDRLLDWELPALGEGQAAEAGADPYRDEVLRTMPRPPMEGAVVIDISSQKVAADLPGSWRRLVPAPGGRVLVATNTAYSFLGP